MKKDEGITLVALVITIIILLILAGVAISMITGGEGLFAQANGAATKYNQAAKNEADLLNQLLNGNYFGNGQGEEEDETEGTSINNDSHVGYYADLDPNDGKIDGIIFADLAVGGSGQWGTEENGYTTYAIPVKTGLKEYYLSETGHEGAFGTKDVLSPKEGSTGEDRFYIMALESSGGLRTWYKSAIGKMTDYATATSEDFGTGRANTNKIMEYWNNEEPYGAQSSDDLWGIIQADVNKGWFVPSRAEWAAFAGELRITKENYRNYNISGLCWSSSQKDIDQAWLTAFSHNVGSIIGEKVNTHDTFYVHLATTF